MSSSKQRKAQLANWQEVCSSLTKFERKRHREVEDLFALQTQNEQVLDLKESDIVQRLPQIKKQHSDRVKNLSDLSMTITSTQNKLAILLSVLDTPEERTAQAEAHQQAVIAAAGSLERSNSANSSSSINSSHAPSVFSIAPSAILPNPMATSSAAAAAAATAASSFDPLLAPRSALDEHVANVPVIKGKQPLPPLCGALPAASDYICPENSLCAVWRKEQWIVCQVIKAQKERGGTIRYEMEDVDPEPDPVGLEKRFYVAPRHVIPLPTSIPDANRQKPPEAEYEAGSIVLALYPTTTCLYQGTVLQPPSKRKQTNNYLIEFVGDPPEQQEIVQQAIVPYRKKYTKVQ